VTARPDIHDEVWALCAKLGLEPNLVTELVIEPRAVDATVRSTAIRHNTQGKPYLVGYGDDKRIATVSRRFPVST
jgi:hypothetical protein